jgi:hypothetical protein
MDLWTSDLDLDNTVIFRYRVDKPGWEAPVEHQA